eukprot:6172394-Pleurochrysis_carterae.AAC.4
MIAFNYESRCLFVKSRTCVFVPCPVAPVAHKAARARESRAEAKVHLVCTRWFYLNSLFKVELDAGSAFGFALFITTIICHISSAMSNFIKRAWDNQSLNIFEMVRTITVCNCMGFRKLVRVRISDKWGRGRDHGDQSGRKMQPNGPLSTF